MELVDISGQRFLEASGVGAALASRPLDVQSQYDSSKISHLLGWFWLSSRKNVSPIISSARQSIDQVFTTHPACVCLKVIFKSM